MYSFVTRPPKAWALLAACALLAGCGDLATATRDDASMRLSAEDTRARLATSVTTGTVTRVSAQFLTGAIDRGTWRLEIGRTQTFGAMAYDSANRVITGRPVRYRSSNPAYLAIDSVSGVATGIAPGIVSVTATVDGVSGRTGNFSIVVATPAPPPPAPTVADVVLRTVSGAMDTTSWTLVTGSAQQFAAAALDSAGATVAGVTPVYGSTNRAVLVVDSLTGASSAVAPGTARVTAAAGGVADTSRVVTVAAPATPTQPTASAIPLTVVRFDGKTGAATVTAGIPLVPGALPAGQENRVRVFVGGVEQTVYVAGLHSLHPDGSRRAVLVQFQLASLSSTPQSGHLDLAVARTAAKTLASPAVTPGTPATGAPAGLPQATALPVDPSYLIATDLVGATTTSAANSALGGVYARYESDFVTYSTTHWAAEGANWAGNYYDRALAYYAMWVRTGNTTYWARAGQIAYDYRTKYLAPSGYSASPHWAQLEGLEKHYLLTGDDVSRHAVVQTANRLQAGYLNSAYMTSAKGEGRIAARVLHSLLLGWRLTPSGAPLVSGITAATWGANIEIAIAKLVTWQAANGGYPAYGQVCGGQLNYMVGMLNDALIKTYEYYQPAVTPRATLQTTMRTLVKKAVDYMWSTQWIASSAAFKYASVTCSGVGSTSAAPDLNNIISVGFGWVYRQTGIASYRTNGDLIFAGGVTKAYLTGSKQFNENYGSSFRYLGYR